jgi:hypothetical protein
MKVRDRRRIARLLAAAAVLAFGFWAPSLIANEPSCSRYDLQKCKSCAELLPLASTEDPNSGSYFRGTLWNELYSSYVLDCFSIGELLINRGANPNAGGDFGLFAIALTQEWPHNDININKKWLKMLLVRGLSVKWKSQVTKENSEQLVSSGLVALNYPEIWKQLRNGGRR